MPIDLLGSRLIFIISPARSGSTLLQRMLAAHPEVYTFSETYVLLPVLRVLTDRCVLGDETHQISTRIRLFLRELDEDEQNIYLSAVRQMTTSLYNAALNKFGKKYFLEKGTLYYAYILPEIHRLFPLAKFIILVRNPIGILCSTIRTWTGPDPKLLVDHFHRPNLVEVPFLLADAINFLGDNCALVRYEDLVRDPENELRRLCEKIGLSYHDQMVEYGKNPLPRWEFGDQFIYSAMRPIAQRAEIWKHEIREPNVWRLAREYVRILGRNTVEVLGYSYSDIEACINQTKPNKISFLLDLLARRARTPLLRIKRFLAKPRSHKKQIIKWMWNRWMAPIPIVCRLPYGWWLAWSDTVGDAVFCGTYEKNERSFFEKFLHAGSMVFDIGAHQGFYTLLASRLVGPEGRVFAFEPSPRERRRLKWTLRINRCRNVRVEPLALASQEGELPLFVVQGKETGFNSLRPPKVSEPVRVIPVQATTLDAYIRRAGIERVDFIKMDVEGAELEVLRGAEQLLRKVPRPVWMCEVQDIRTEAFGYSSKDILEFLWQRGFRWFKIAECGRLLPLTSPEELLHWPGYNFVAVPEERLHEIDHLLVDSEDGERRDEGVSSGGY